MIVNIIILSDLATKFRKAELVHVTYQNLLTLVTRKKKDSAKLFPFNHSPMKNRLLHQPPYLFQN